MSKSRKNPSANWELAARLCQSPLDGSGKAETILDQYVSKISRAERRYCQRLFFAFVRHQRLIQYTVSKLVAQTPRPKLLGLLHAAMADSLESEPEKQAAVVDYWVGNTRQMLSKGEAGLMNAVLRRANELWQTPEILANPALRYSYPEWLAQRWMAELGEESAAALMAWNQQPAEVFLRLRGEWAELPAGCESTDWPGFVRWTGKADWEEIGTHLKSGRLYAQDPATRLAPGLLDVQLGESVLDLCAAPGGKSLLLADALGENSNGELVCVDMPGPRLEQLDENLQKLNSGEGPSVQLMGSDVLDLDVEEIGQFDAILLDAPCSNTGVIRRRPDVKWRLQSESIEDMAELQLTLLEKAVEFLKPEGRIVYSTCSIESLENEQLIEAFLQSNSDFTCVSGQTVLPHEAGHDGAGLFLIKYQ